MHPPSPGADLAHLSPDVERQLDAFMARTREAHALTRAAIAELAFLGVQTVGLTLGLPGVACLEVACLDWKRVLHHLADPHETAIATPGGVHISAVLRLGEPHLEVWTCFRPSDVTPEVWAELLRQAGAAPQAQEDLDEEEEAPTYFQLCLVQSHGPGGSPASDEASERGAQAHGR